MKTELLREMNCGFLQNRLGDPTLLFHLIEENTTLDLHDIAKSEDSNFPINSILQSDFRHFTGSVQIIDLSIISLL